MTRGWLAGGLGQALLCGLVAAGIVNILATFATPELLRPNAYERISEHLPANSMVVLPRTGPETQLLPYQEPDMHYAICNYDISNGPVSAQVVLPSSGWTLALYSPAGDNFYVMPGREQRITTINALLVPAGDEVALPPITGQSAGRTATPTYINVPALAGLMVIKAPIKGESFGEEVDTVLARASCGQAGTRTPSGG